MEQVGLDAVPLVALLSFLVGAVIAFLGANILRDFGAVIFVVELVNVAFLREFGVLLTAIILAGRTASAFTAQIGAMTSREEVDAIRTLGLDPIDLLVLPRVIALVVMLPLLTFIAMLAGLAGGMTVGAFSLDIPPRSLLRAHGRDHGAAPFPGRHEQGAAVRGGDRPGRLPRGPAGRRHRAIGGRAHHLQRGAGDLAGDHPRRDHGDLVHADGMVMATPAKDRGDQPQRRRADHPRARPDNRFGEQVVHEGLDLDVRRGEILGVVGGSGTGKSVLMRSILGLRTPDAGEIEVLGVDARSRRSGKDRLHIQRRTGVLFQDGALFSSLTVGENVQVPLKEHHPELPDSLRYELALLKVKLAGLPADALNKLPSQLSGGMRKRAGLARALALDPPLLFLDEPTAGLDPIGAAAFDELILTLQRALGLTVFLITHDLDTLYAICDRVAVLADRKLVINAPIAEVEQLRPSLGAGILPRPARPRCAGFTAGAGMMRRAPGA